MLEFLGGVQIDTELKVSLQHMRDWYEKDILPPWV